MVEPLAPSDSEQSNTNLSRSLSLTILDEGGNEISLRASMNNPIEFIIPRDPQSSVPSLILQNVTSISMTNHSTSFNLRWIDLTLSNPNHSMSLNIDMRPVNSSIAYLLIYRFDRAPLLNNDTSQLDGWSCFCPTSNSLLRLRNIVLSVDNLYRFFLDNDQTFNHRSLIFGLRELNETETNGCCTAHQQYPPVSDQPIQWTSNYYLRSYRSSCCYLDSNNFWRTDGLRVSFVPDLVESDGLVRSRSDL